MMTRHRGGGSSVLRTRRKSGSFAAKARSLGLLLKSPPSHTASPNKDETTTTIGSPLKSCMPANNVRKGLIASKATSVKPIDVPLVQDDQRGCIDDTPSSENVKIKLKSCLRVRLPSDAQHGVPCSAYEAPGSCSPFKSADIEAPRKSTSRRVRWNGDDQLTTTSPRRSGTAKVAESSQCSRESDPPFGFSDDPIFKKPSWMRWGRSYKGFCHFGKLISKEFPHGDLKGLPVVQPQPAIPRIDCSTITAREFHHFFVKARRPCVLYNCQEFEPVLKQWSQDEYLKKAAGSIKCDVEVRNVQFGNFGEGNKANITFGQLVDAVAAGDEKYYMTTQQLTENDDGPMRLAGDLLLGTSLGDDLPEAPAVAGSLVPYQMNVWFGHSASGSSTGLHHDYHDNFYLVIRGSKTFRLYSPRCAELLDVTGKIRGIHPNGLITYDSATRADGADCLSVFDWRVSQTEAEISVLQGRLAAARGLIKDAAYLVKRLRAIALKRRQPCYFLKDLKSPRCNYVLGRLLSGQNNEVSLDKFPLVPEHFESDLSSRKESSKLLEAYLSDAKSRLQMFRQKIQDLEAGKHLESVDNGITTDSTAFGGKTDSIFPSDADSSGSDISMVKASSTKPTDESLGTIEGLFASLSSIKQKELEAKRGALRSKLGRSSSDSEPSPQTKEQLSLSKSRGDAKKKQKANLDCETAVPVGVKPYHFCARNTVTAHLEDHVYTRSSFPETTDTLLQQYLEVCLSPGDVLYLPASWFHEVISQSAPDCTISNSKKHVASGHMALQWWFYPAAARSATPKALDYDASGDFCIARSLGYNSECRPGDFELTEIDFEEPYPDEYWAARRRRLAQGTEDDMSFLNNNSLNQLLRSFIVQNNSLLGDSEESSDSRSPFKAISDDIRWIDLLGGSTPASKDEDCGPVALSSPFWALDDDEDSNFINFEDDSSAISSKVVENYGDNGGADKTTVKSTTASKKKTRRKRRKSKDDN